MTRALLTSDDIAKWRTRLDQIGREEARLAVERGEIQKKLDAVSVLFGGIPEAERERTQGQPVVDSGAPETRSWGDRPSWPSEITRIFEDLRTHLTFDQLREELEKGPLKGEYAKSDKGFYHAVSRLQERDYLFKYKGWLFRKCDYEEHKKNVEAGVVEDVKENSASSRKSPMGEEVKKFLSRNFEGVSSADIIAHLKADERFAETLTKNATGAYNVISRLVKRGEIRKEGRTIYPLKENEPPNGGSETGKGDTFPNQAEQSDRGDLLSYRS